MFAIDPRGGRAGVVVLSLLAVGSVADAWTGWFTRAFDVVAHQFYEIALLAALRRPSQLALARVHVLTLGVLTALGLLLWSRLDRHRRWWWAAFLVAYAIRAAVWIAGSNLPLVPGDGSHYVEVASSVYRGEGPVKHYVESFFIPYPAIREGRGTLDDWATPLYAYVVAGAYRLVGIVPGGWPDTAQIAAGTKKGNGLIEAVHIVLNKLIEDGTYTDLLEFWGLDSEAVTSSEINPPGLPKP